jgi:hypothetical protein
MRTPTRVALVGAAVVGLAAPQSAAHAADTVPPTVSIDVRGTSNAGWYEDAADVTVTAGDRSGIDVGSSSITLSGATNLTTELQDGTTSLRITASGETRVLATVYDNEGNVRRSSTTVSVDGVAPRAVIGGVSQGERLQVGSRRQATTTCDDAHSGISSCELTGNGVGRDGVLVTDRPGVFHLDLTAYDRVGHRSSDYLTYTVVSPESRPTVSLTPSRPADRNGWHRAPVDVLVRGVAGHPSLPITGLTWWTDRDDTRRSARAEGEDVRVDQEGATAVHATSTDWSGTDSVTGTQVVLLDTVAPTASIGDLGEVRQHDRVEPTTRCDDVTSGVDGCELVGGVRADGTLDTSSPGTQTLRLRAVDVAGNTSIIERTVTVLPQQVDPEPEPDRSTTTTLTAPGQVSSRATASVQVTVGHEVGLSGGTVTVRDGSRVVATRTVEPTRAVNPVTRFTTRTTLVLPRLSVGTHRLTATFASPDAQSSTSSVRSVVVKSPATVRASSWKVSRKKAGSVKVSVVGRDAKATGTVRVLRGSKVVGTARLGSKGTATVRLARLPQGRQTLTVVYPGSTRVLPARLAVRVTVR